MTIKHLGGIFGRNPTFNDVDVENDLNVGSSDGKSHWTSGSEMNLSIAESQNYPGISSMSYSTVASAGGMIILGHSDNATSGTLSETGNGDALGYLSFEGVNSSSALVSGAYIKSVQEGAAGSSYIPGKIEFYTSTGSASPRQSIRIDKDAHIQMAGGGNVVFTSGAGIDFSATAGTGTSELFDDYEEGDFSPSYSASGLSVTHDTQVGKYTKVGRLVCFTIALGSDAASGTGSSQLKITGLPYTSSGQASGIVGLAYSFSSSQQDAKWIIQSGSTTIDLYDGASNTAGVLPSSVLGTGTNNNRLQIFGFYHT